MGKGRQGERREMKYKEGRTRKGGQGEGKAGKEHKKGRTREGNGRELKEGGIMGERTREGWVRSEERGNEYKEGRTRGVKSMKGA